MKILIIAILAAIPLASFGAVSARPSVRVNTYKPSTVKTVKPVNKPVAKPVQKPKQTTSPDTNTTVKTNTYSYNPFSTNFFLWYLIFANNEEDRTDKGTKK